MGKECLTLGRVNKAQAAALLTPFHYLTKTQKGFKTGFNYGLFCDDTLVGVCIFTIIPVKELLKGCFGLPEGSSQKGLFELSRLVLAPDFQASEYNAASWFVSRALRALRRDTSVRAVLSYADDTHHSGVVYAACNFKYYGKTSAKKDFYFEGPEGLIKHSRGSVKGRKGVWVERSQKHRFLTVYDKTLSIKWDEMKWANPNNNNKMANDLGVV